MNCRVVNFCGVFVLCEEMVVFVFLLSIYKEEFVVFNVFCVLGCEVLNIFISIIV